MFRLRFMLLTFSFIFVCCAVPKVQAITYSGMLIKSEPSWRLRLKDEGTGKSYELTAATTAVSAVIKNLAAGDYVSFNGARSSTVNSIRVDSINFVGLKNLLYSWKGNDRFCYSFLSFTELAISPLENSKCIKNPSEARTYAYTVNPTTDSSWVILLSDNQGSYAADLTLKKEGLIEIHLYDSNTGYSLKVIKLRK